ncbi:MAG: hypothetical protein HYV63_20610 [Candidatus Schekmanbacteria bacterium]|nr:hypothetical protein [Candidatus Schekmanbacteria bacterium]
MEHVLPWIGGRKVHARGRSFVIAGQLPQEHGWCRFAPAGGRRVRFVASAEPDPAFGDDGPVRRGYLVGDRLIPDEARVDPDPALLVKQTLPVHLVEPGLERFCRAAVIADPDGELLFLRRDFPLGPEPQVLAAYLDRRASLDQIPAVTPALDLAFRWLSWQRDLAERRRQELERLREQEERQRQALRDAGSGLRRRALAARDFEAAARAALMLSGAELLDAHPAYGGNDMTVQYRFRERRLECVVDKHTLRVTDAGICLRDERTGECGDTYFTLESLPVVVGQAMDERALVVFRHVAADGNHYYDGEDVADD